MKYRRILNVILPFITAAFFYVAVMYFVGSINTRIFLLSGIFCFFAGVSIYDSVELLVEKHYKSSRNSLSVVPIFLLVSVICYELGLFEIRNDSYFNMLPEFSVEIAPVVIVIAFLDVYHKKKTGEHSKSLVFICFLLSLLLFIGTVNYAFSFSYIYLNITLHQIYSYLAILYITMITLAAIEIIFSSEKVRLYNAFIVHALIAEIAMNILEYINGIVLSAITVNITVTPALYFRATVFSIFTSFPVSILFALLFVGSVLKKATFGDYDNSQTFFTVKHTEDGYEIPPNTPSL